MLGILNFFRRWRWLVSFTCWTKSQ